jgi:pantothenate kinase
MTQMRLESMAAVADAARGHRMIGIVGPPGAGKSTIAAALVDLLPGAALLPMDGFHLPQARLVELGRRDRMGAPDTFDVDAFVATLAAVRDSGRTVRAPAFDRDTEEAIPNAIEILPESRTVVVEGNYLLLGGDVENSGGWERVARLLDVTFFVDLPRDIRHQRLIARHIAFGKSEADAAAWALGPDESNARLIEATAFRADHEIALPG